MCGTCVCVCVHVCTCVCACKKVTYLSKNTAEQANSFPVTQDSQSCSESLDPVKQVPLKGCWFADGRHMHAICTCIIHNSHLNVLELYNITGRLMGLTKQHKECNRIP